MPEDQLSTCSCGKKSIKGSDWGGSTYGGASHVGNYKDYIPNKCSSKLSDVSSVSDIQEMTFTLGGLNHHYFSGFPLM